MDPTAIFTLIGALGGGGAIAAIVQGVFNRRQISSAAAALLDKSATSRIVAIGKELDNHRRWDYIAYDRLVRLGVTDIDPPPSLWIDYQ